MRAEKQVEQLMIARPIFLHLEWRHGLRARVRAGTQVQRPCEWAPGQ